MNINDFGRNSFVTHTTGLIERLEKCTMNELQEKILAVLDMSEDEQFNWCITHIEECDIEGSLADLAFRLSGGKIAGKKPIEYIIDALLAKESK